MNPQFDPTEKILFLDFDHTCYDTDAFLLNEIRQPMLSRFNIPTKIWEESYDKAVRVGYSLEQHLNELTKIMKVAPCSLEEMQEFDKTIKFDKYLFKDVIPFLKEAKEKGYKIMLLSFGATSWQNKKVLGVGLDKLVDLIRYTKKEGSKLEVISQFANNSGKMIFIDNNGLDLDAVRKKLPNVETYYINRPQDDIKNKEDAEYLRIKYLESRKMAERPLLFTYKLCKTLKDIIL